MLQDLVGMDHVIGRIGLVEVVHVAGTEGEVRRRMVAGGGRDDVGRGVDARDPPGIHPASDVGGDRSRSAADVEHRRARHQPGEEVAG